MGINDDSTYSPSMDHQLKIDGPLPREIRNGIISDVYVRLSSLEKDVSFVNRTIDKMDLTIDKSNELISAVTKLIDSQDRQLLQLNNIVENNVNKIENIDKKVETLIKNVDNFNRIKWIIFGGIIILTFLLDGTGIATKSVKFILG